jgi:hypothetical protein
MVFTAIFSIIVVLGIGGSLVARVASPHRVNWIAQDRKLARREAVAQAIRPYLWNI